MDHKTGRGVNCKEKWVKVSLYSHIPYLRKWGFKQKVPRKVHVNTALPEEKEAFKKRQNRYLGIKNNNNNNNRRKKKNKKNKSSDLR